MEMKIEQVKEESQSKTTFLRHKLHAKKLLRIEVIYITIMVIGYDYRKDVAACRN